jgi:cold shock CspA family protein
VVSIRDTFGFIQPYLSEDQIFFALRDAYREVSIGDEISFVSRMTPKGWQAEALRKVLPEHKASTAGVRGIVTREPDTYRGTPGLIKVETPGSTSAAGGIPTAPKETYIIPYLAEDSGSAGGAPKPRSNDARERTRPSIVKGDEVEFSLVKIEGTVYARAQLLRVTRTKRDRLMAEQVNE